MTRTIKAAVLIICCSVCTIGVLFLPTDTAKDPETRTQILPVNNRQPHRGPWLRV